MDLLYYLANKPIKGFFCPHCFDWHTGEGGKTIAEYFKEEKMQYKHTLSSDDPFKQENQFCCKQNCVAPPYGIAHPVSVDFIYDIVFKNGVLNFAGSADSRYYHGCEADANFKGNISLQEIVNNCVLSEIHDNYLDVYFFLNCYKLHSCFECKRYGNEYYMCEDFESVLEQNELFYHEHSPRTHFTTLLGFRYKIEKGDPIFNCEKLRRMYNDFKRKILLLKKRIPALERLIDILQNNGLIKNPNEIQEVNNIKSELEALLSKVTEVNRKVSELYGESEDNIFSEKDKQRDGRFYKIDMSLPLMGFWKQNLIAHKKAKEDMEQEAGEIITIYMGIQSELNNIKNKVDQIAEKLRQIQGKQFMEF